MRQFIATVLFLCVQSAMLFGKSHPKIAPDLAPASRSKPTAFRRSASSGSGCFARRYATRLSVDVLALAVAHSLRCPRCRNYFRRLSVAGGTYRLSAGSWSLDIPAGVL